MASGKDKAIKQLMCVLYQYVPIICTDCHVDPQ